MEKKSRHTMRQVHTTQYYYGINLVKWGSYVCSHQVSRASSRTNSRAKSRRESSMSSSIHQARFGSPSFISSRSNLTSSSWKHLAADSIRFQKPVTQVRDIVLMNLQWWWHNIMCTMINTCNCMHVACTCLYRVSMCTCHNLTFSGCYDQCKGICAFSPHEYWPGTYCKHCVKLLLWARNKINVVHFLCTDAQWVK